MKNILLSLLTSSIGAGGITAAEFTSERQILKKAGERELHLYLVLICVQSGRVPPKSI